MENKILETSDYERFKFVEGNRNIDSRHVKNLIDSIKKENLLYLKPILVDENMFILDGQHRLEAARSLGVPVYFFQVKSTNYKEILILNQNNKNWKLIDFLNFHAFKNKNDHYLKVIQTMNKYGFSLPEFFIYCNHNFRKIKNKKAFEDGEFIFLHNDDFFSDLYSKWKYFKEFAKEKNLDHADCIDSLVFKESFLYFHNSKQISLDQFWEKLRSSPTYFHRCVNKDQFLDMFLKIYNHSVTYKIEKGML